jgi:hypothetical protein
MIYIPSVVKLVHAFKVNGGGVHIQRGDRVRLL